MNGIFLRRKTFLKKDVMEVVLIMDWIASGVVGIILGHTPVEDIKHSQ